jgi:hypothetical protein
MEWLQLIPLCAEQFELQVGVAGIVFGLARGEGFAIPRSCQRIDREEAQKGIRAQGEDQRPFVACEAESHGVAVKPCTQGGDPGIDSLGRMLQLEALALYRASRLEASSMCGIRPVDPNKGRKGVV